MVVLHIVLWILKAVGILLLFLLALVVLLVLAVLFSPVRYNARVQKEEEYYEGEAGISWLSHLVSVKLRFGNREGAGGYSVRLLGFPVSRAAAFFSGRKEKKQRNEPVREEGQEKFQKKAEEKSREKTEEEIQKEIEEKVEKKVREKMQKSSGRKEKRTLQNFRLTVEEICAKIKNILEFMKSQQFLNGRSLVLKESKRLVLHIVPRKIRGILKFGTDDPCVTGQILAAASIFYPLYGEHFTIEPYFDRNILEGEIYVRGRIYGMALLRMAWNLFWDSDVRYIVKKFKQH